MACDITIGRLLGCRDQVGGVKAVYLIDFADIPVLTFDADEQISAFATGLTSVFRYDFQAETGSFEEVITSSLENGTVFYEQNLEINLFALTKEDRKEIQLIATNTLGIFIEDFNGNVRLMGMDGGATISGGSVKTGKTKGDMSGYTITFQAKEKDQSAFVVPFTTDPFDGLTGATVAAPTATNEIVITTV